MEVSRRRRSELSPSPCETCGEKKSGAGEGFSPVLQFPPVSFPSTFAHSFITDAT
jgi:hypothetical protein